ncbi:hypothetical protein M514_01916 [Trichuris suis]|uniref:Uncharacterized protein n=1 Tax=Trichuris suis TaxID=68888 RepID=A0A085MYH7_9BILA|nr:hypothetical protein M513_01916 [Trichuris suis]KFD62273.1 hypothetical protein M514_01916 [Trichuris suis]
MMKFALFVLFALAFQNAFEVDAKDLKACLEEDCLELFEQAKPCYRGTTQDACSTKRTESLLKHQWWSLQKLEYLNGMGFSYGKEEYASKF